MLPVPWVLIDGGKVTRAFARMDYDLLEFPKGSTEYLTAIRLVAKGKPMEADNG